jgi:hypothetical protein
MLKKEVFWSRKPTLSAVIVILVAAWPALASAGDNADPLVEKLRACVRSKAPAARADGILTAGDAVPYFVRECLPDWGRLPVAGLFRGDEAESAPARSVQAIQPGAFRIVIKEEWAAFLARMDQP